ncbi:MAG: ATP-binding protein [Gemmatimonadota bacterium]|nr:ATP-binding protein [Gemmatimonadota bacterium]MDE2953592.1 ATP-binding protein [Gemmatimonadota bacterium]
MNSPRTLQDLKNMIKNQIQENIHLDYKRSSALSSQNSHREIAKDVSAFANSDGGCIIYGIEEDKHLPKRIDSGVDHYKYTREWLENVITSNISPRIDGITISPIPLSPDNSVYIVDIPKSSRGPHQDRGNHRYYKRFNFKSQPMEDYEINDIRSRNHTVKPLINIDIETEHSFLIYLVIENIGEAVAENVRLNFTPEPTWPGDIETAPILKNGIRFFPPKRRFNIRYRSFPEVLNETNSIVSTFNVTAKYFNPEIEQEVSDSFFIDLRDFHYTSDLESTIYSQGQKIEKALKDLTRETKRVGDILNKFSTLGGATGLDLSITTLRNIQRILNQQDDLEKISPYCDGRVFKEILGIDVHLAYRISNFFRYQNSEKSIMDIEGITEEIVEKLKRHFRID